MRSLSGMFGLAIWDARRRRLVLARDRVGKKPLFYSLHDGALSFASELRALLEDPGSRASWTIGRSTPTWRSAGSRPATASSTAVRKLPPASLLVLERGAARIERYWSLDYNRKREAAGRPGGARGDPRRRSGAPFGAGWSPTCPSGPSSQGGSTPRPSSRRWPRHRAEPVRTFSIGFSHDRYDELAKARLIAERFATDHEEFVVDPRRGRRSCRGSLRQYGEPFADSSAIPTFYVAELARRRVTVALDRRRRRRELRRLQRATSAGLALQQVGPHAAGRCGGRSAALAAGSRPAAASTPSRSRLRRLGAAATLERGRAPRRLLDASPAAERAGLYAPGFRELVGRAC